MSAFDAHRRLATRDIVQVKGFHRVAREGPEKQRIRIRIRCLVGVAVVLSLVGAACGKGADASHGGSATSSGSPAGTTMASLEQGPGNALVFSPTTLTVNRGEVVAVNDVGSVSHTFTISDRGIDVVNDPGQSQQITIDLPPGTYPFICRFHVQAGMTGTLIVQ